VGVRDAGEQARQPQLPTIGRLQAHARPDRRSSSIDLRSDRLIYSTDPRRRPLQKRAATAAAPIISDAPPRTASSLNVGPEQEKLDNLVGAIVEVTALASPMQAVPHVELHAIVAISIVVSSRPIEMM
jgi:hypothetical protein